MAKQIEQTGKSISEAVETAVKKLGVELGDVEYKVLDEGSKGFLGLGARPAKVLVTVNNSESAEEILEEVNIEEVKEESPRSFFKKEKKQESIKVKEIIIEETVTEQVVAEETVSAEAAQTQAPAESQRASLTEEDKNIILNTATDFLKNIFNTMGMEVKMSASFEDNKQILINIEGEEMGTIIGKRGQTLDSLQYLTNLVVNKGEYPYMNVTIDTENYRLRRKETLEHLAFNLAKKAKHNRRNVTLEPMNPYERRIIHATLQNDRYVTTYSEGVEPFRYVVIALKNNYSKKRYNNRTQGNNNSAEKTQE